MKRIFLAIVAILTAFAVEAETIQVHNQNEFRNAIQKNADIVLCNDINMHDWDTYDDIPYTGTIDGGYDNGKRHALTHSNNPIFNQLKNATVKNVEFTDADMNADTKLYGVLTCQSDGCHYENLMFNKCQILTDGFTDNSPGGTTGKMGLVTGSAEGACTFKRIFVKASRLDSEDGPEVGAVAGYANGGVFEDCAVDGASNIYGQANVNARVGGICGANYKADGRKGSFKNCINMGIVNANDKPDEVGGICGYSEDADYTDCKNFGLSAQIGGDFQPLTLMDMYSAVSFPEKIVELSELSEAVVTGCSAISCVTFLLTVGQLIYDFSEADEVGGICGHAESGTFNSCSNYGIVHTMDSAAGGILGIGNGKIIIHGCLNAGYVTGKEQIGGIVGSISGPDSNIMGCLNMANVYASEGETGNGIVGGVSDHVRAFHNVTVGATAKDNGDTESTVRQEDLVTGEVGAYLNEGLGQTWKQNIGTDKYPMPYCDVKTDKPVCHFSHSADIYTYVNNADEFKAAMALPYNNIKLNNDIVFDAAGMFSIVRNPFHGTIDGQGHTITVTTQSEDHTDKYALIKAGGYALLYPNDAHYPKKINVGDNGGFFSKLDGATIKNLTLKDVNYNGSTNVGGLCGEAYDSNFENITIEHGCVFGSNQFVGALVGYMKNCTVKDCTTKSDVKVFSAGDDMNSNVGGLVGAAEKCTIDDCENNAEVIGDENIIGGIVGQAIDTNFLGCVNNAYVHSFDVDGPEETLGGIVGWGDGINIDKCVNNGKCEVGNDKIGGIVGWGFNFTINNCHSHGLIDGEQGNTGGIVGDTGGNNNVINNCLVTAKVLKDGSQSTRWGVGGTGDVSVRNCFYLYGGGGGGGNNTKVNQQQVESGEVTYRLQENLNTSEEPTWAQTIGKDKYPMFYNKDNADEHKEVYEFGYNQYTNDRFATPSQSKTNSLDASFSVTSGAKKVATANGGFNIVKSDGTVVDMYGNRVK